MSDLASQGDRLLTKNGDEVFSVPISHWFVAMRPKTLTAAVVPVLAGTALAKFVVGTIQPWIFVCCLVSALCIQIATNFINDYVDFDKGADTAERIGPVRVTQSGLITKKTLKWTTFWILGLAFATGVPLVIAGGWPILIVGLISLFLAYSYTGGPWPLAYLGLGDIFVILFFGVIAVGGVYYLQTGQSSTMALVLGLQIGFLSTVLIAINNLRDVHQDKKANKKTLPVRFGISFARTEIYALVMVPFVLQFYWLPYLGRNVTFLPFILLPLALGLVQSIRRTDPSPMYNQFLARSALLHGGFGVVLAISLYLS